MYFSSQLQRALIDLQISEALGKPSHFLFPYPVTPTPRHSDTPIPRYSIDKFAYFIPS